MLTDEEIRELKKSSTKTRINIIKMVHAAKSGHPGGSLSGADILNVLYKKCLNIPKEWDKSPEFKVRDRFILSKGHASPLLYSVLAQCGFFPEEDLMTFRKFGSKLQGHPAKGYVKGVETSTGSLGQGISIGCGIAMGLKLDNNPAHVVVYTGDGELQEGSCWEAFMEAAHRNLNNLIVIIDRNRLQIDGNTENVMGLDNLHDKLRSFNWDVTEINGHNYNQIYEAYNQAKKTSRPCAIIANTIKGKGVSYMENQAGWHGKAPNDEEFKIAIDELEEAK
jgi:transketolase